MNGTGIQSAKSSTNLAFLALVFFMKPLWAPASLQPPSAGPSVGPAEPSPLLLLERLAPTQDGVGRGR